MLLAGLYSLLMWGLCRVLLHALLAVRSAANWLARIGPDGVLLKYRSYLHDDLPAEDPIAVHLGWHEIAAAELQKERYTTTDIDETHQITRWFLALTLAPRYVAVERIKTALEFEFQRKPAYHKVNNLKHELFEARKRGAANSEIAQLKQQIALEKRRHPGKHNRSRFHDRPVVFIKPDVLRMEWTHISPGRKKLCRLLERYTAVSDGQRQDIDIVRPMGEAEFHALLATLLSHDETIEAVKLVRMQRNLGITEAKAYIEKFRQ